ncbi:MAG: ELM1/GtrOC1 family putative glycosyltransferase [Myxococcota bacterium]
MTQLDRIVLPALEEAQDGSLDPLPPVRIFVGTEHGQHRAERVFVWSVMQVRNPAREYQIVLMKDLPGFDSTRWLTGFTNYRFVIPHLAERRGRAIYNDVDQVYLVDPAELFDTPMQGLGFLSINPFETSVMLIDCERMCGLWTPERARTTRRKSMEKLATSRPGVWGELDDRWNARDTEYVAGRTGVLHYTTIHTQPWMPFPERFVYQPNRVAQVWHALERSADEAGYELFSASSPSTRYRKAVERLAARQVGSNRPVPALERALEQEAVRSVLEFGIGQLDSRLPPVDEVGGRTVVRHDPAHPRFAKEPSEHLDAVVCRGGLEAVPDADVPWLIDWMFRMARRYVHIELDPVAEVRISRSERRSPPRDRFWWSSRIAAAASRHPGVRWRVEAIERDADRTELAWQRESVDPQRGPRVWVLAEDKAGHTSQSVGLAEALGWPFEVKRLRFNAWNRVNLGLLGASDRTLAAASRRAIEGPPPDLVIATGRRVAPVARFVAERSRGHTRVVQIGRKAAHLADAVDLAVSCAHFRHLPHPRRCETLAPINRIDDARLADAARRWRAELVPEGSPGFVGVLVGGPSATHDVDPETAARIGRDAVAFAEARGLRVVAVTSPRTRPDVARALEASLGTRGRLFRWTPVEAENAYMGCLALADVLVVTGDSESMLGEAASSGRPVLRYPVPRRSPGLRRRGAAWAVARSLARPRKRRKGSVRPQQGLEAFFARLVAKGWIHVPRDIELLYLRLEERGVLRTFGFPPNEIHGPLLREAVDVAVRVRSVLGLPEAEA